MQQKTSPQKKENKKRMYSSWAREGDIYKTRLDSNLSSITYSKMLLKLVSDENKGGGVRI